MRLPVAVALLLAACRAGDHVDTLVVHPMHGLSNRVLGIVSTMQLGALLDAKVLVEWRMDDSKFIGASMRELFNMSELPAFAGPFRRQRLNRPRSDWDGACAGYYRQQRSGWHTAGGGGGFAGPDPAAAFLDYMATRAPPCNDTALAEAGRAGKRRRAPVVARDGCGAHFDAEAAVGTCARAGAADLTLGLSLWSSVVPLNGSCAYAFLPATRETLDLVRWLPPSTLGVHVRRGNLDAAWARATDAEWFDAVDAALAKRGLAHVFLASDDGRLHETFAARYGDTLLPRFEDLPSSKRVAVAGARGVPRGDDGHRRGHLWSRDGNLVSLAEQLSLGSADAVLGTWGSTFSSVAAAWFDRPVDYVPAPRDAACVASEAEAAACPWRGKAHYPTSESSWRFGAKCPELNDAVERRRRGEPARLDVAAARRRAGLPAGAGDDAPRRRPRRKRRPWA